MLKIVQKIPKMTKLNKKKAKTIIQWLEKPKISTPVKKIALTASAASAAFSISKKCIYFLANLEIYE